MAVNDVVASRSAILFDLFFTLISADQLDDSIPTYELLGVAKHQWRAQTSISHPRFRGEVTEPFDIVASMARAIDPGIPDAAIQQAAEQRLQRFRGLLGNPPATTVAALERLRRQGLKLALVTNADGIEMRYWHESPLAPLFDAVAFSFEVGVAKPEPGIYQHALDALDVSAAEAVFVGDGASDELSGASRVGMTTVFARGMVTDVSGMELAARIAMSDHVIRRLDELVAGPEE